jgi:hypothetical protein
MGKSAKTRQASARERIASQRAAQRRKQARRRLLMGIGSVGAVVAVVVALVLVKLNSPSAVAQPAQTDAKVAAEATSVPDSVFDAVGTGGATAPRAVSGLPELTSGGKPEILYMGGKFCPFCAAERWALAAALSRFGTLTGLSFIHSAPDDGDIATMTFESAKYTSKYLTFTPVEWFGEAADPNTPFEHVYFQHPTSAEVALFNKYAGGGIPFIDVGNRYIVGSQFVPTDLSGMTWAQIAAAMHDPSSQVGKDIDGAANEITAAIRALIKS